MQQQKQQTNVVPFVGQLHTQLPAPAPAPESKSTATAMVTGLL